MLVSGRVFIHSFIFRWKPLKPGKEDDFKPVSSPVSTQNNTQDDFRVPLFDRFWGDFWSHWEVKTHDISVLFSFCKGSWLNSYDAPNLNVQAICGRFSLPNGIVSQQEVDT